MTWRLYILVDPRTRKPFYVGLTKSLRARMSAHKCDPASAAYDRVREILSLKLDLIILVLGIYEDRDEGFREEQRLIRSLPDLVNRKTLQEHQIGSSPSYERALP